MQWLRCLGLVGILAGASLMLPSVASAVQPCTVAAPGQFRIEETTFFQVSTAQDPTEIFQCSFAAPVLLPFFNDLMETTIGAPVSDYFDQVFPGIVQLRSDAHNPEIGLEPRATVGLVPVTRVLENGGEGSNGATIVINDHFGNTIATFFVISDVPGGEIPEPSTMLLVGAALPAIWGITRRRGRSGLPVGIS